MWRHRSMSQVGETDESKLMDDTVFRTIFIRLLKNLLKTAEKLEETFKDLNENTKKMEKDQSEIMHTLSEIKNIQSRPPHPKSQTKDLEYEEEKKHPTREAERKKNPKHQGHWQIRVLIQIRIFSSLIFVLAVILSRPIFMGKLVYLKVGLSKVHIHLHRTTFSSNLLMLWPRLVQSLSCSRHQQ
ncbi:hypothetical protein QTO34_009925 [Cnephaeus nilssonii]|uniref:Uncharacterized protein n=1 Tax=Cnephaeus nilssonii TaxID=3371016 RepID=A0AA40HF92_CNENI|nr:hypothetical protein QTO34_009925 [Eptesicus nilssonii]